MHRHIIAPLTSSITRPCLNANYNGGSRAKDKPAAIRRHASTFASSMYLSYILGPHTKDRSYMCHTTHRYLAQHTIQLHVSAAIASLPLTQTICVKLCNETCRNSQYLHMATSCSFSHNEILHQSNLHTNSHKPIASTHQAYALHTPSSRLAHTRTT